MERPDHSRYQGQCVRICACASRPHPFLAILSAVRAACPFHARSHAPSARLWRVGFRGREHARHGHQLEQFHSERHAWRDILGRKPNSFGILQSSYRDGWWWQDYRITGHVR